MAGFESPESRSLVYHFYTLLHGLFIVNMLKTKWTKKIECSEDYKKAKKADDIISGTKNGFFKKFFFLYIYIEHFNEQYPSGLLFKNIDW